MNIHTPRPFVSAETATRESVNAALAEAFDLAFGYVPVLTTPKLKHGFAAEIRRRLILGQSPKRIAHEVGCTVHTVYYHAKKARA